MKLTDENILALLKGLRVCIVGGFDSIAWSYIRQSDFIIRINNHHLRQGGAMHANYNACCEPVTERIGQCHFFALDLAGPYYPDFLKHGINTYSYENQISYKNNHWLLRLAREFKSKPLTGIVAIQHALIAKTEKIYLTGMTFYANQTIPDKRDNHAPLIQAQWLKRKVSEDSRLHPDTKLARILNDI